MLTRDDLDREHTAAEINIRLILAKAGLPRREVREEGYPLPNGYVGRNLEHLRKMLRRRARRSGRAVAALALALGTMALADASLRAALAAGRVCEFVAAGDACNAR